MIHSMIHSLTTAFARALHPQDIVDSFFNENSIQTESDFYWEEGRRIDMNAFDQLPREVRDYINEYDSFFPIEDVLYEHVNWLGGDPKRTIEWLRSHPCQEVIHS